MSFINECTEEERIEELGEIIKSSNELKENRNLIIYIENFLLVLEVSENILVCLKIAKKTL